MIVLDASVWISSIRGDEVHHQASRRWWATWRDTGIPVIVPAHFLAEVAGTIARALDSEFDGIAAMRDVLNEPLITPAPLTNTIAEAAARAAARCRVRAGDALYVALAEELGVPLITWDDQLLDRARVLVDVRRPTA